jgi:hypothetical protein
MDPIESNGWMIMDTEVERTWKEAFVLNIRYYPRYRLEDVRKTKKR